MTLIKSISGIRGTIGGNPNNNLTPVDIIKFISAYGILIKEKKKKRKKLKIVVGRDARISGKIIEKLVVSTLQSLGFDVINIGLATTPTTEIAVINEEADGGIIITASHNPMQWNALKLLNNKGEFFSAKDGIEVIQLAENENFVYENIENLGTEILYTDYEEIHINKILNLDIVKVEEIKKSKFKVAIDCVNSVGGIVIPKLLKSLGIDDIIELNCEPNGKFAHNPEPLPENLTEISKVIKEKGADVGFVVDPDVDRLAIICEDGTMFGEEYTLVSVADYVLSLKKGNTVSNLSSTRALRDISEKNGVEYFSAAVGEVNVVEKMRKTNAVIGGEGNGGVIFPELHFGRDALVGIALFLSLMVTKNKKVSEIKKSLPQYFISKNKIALNEDTDIDNILLKIKEKYKYHHITDIDGTKIDFFETKEWVHLRKSNTEAIIRIYAESQDEKKAEQLAEMIIELIKKM
ncbi:MAG: phosphoglucosamine mutase [Bacteroidales bacterium]|jgi:phosphomannomutase|nr:phosphoglucosamine mutase [Bacteroidales bacterium]